MLVTECTFPNMGNRLKELRNSLGWTLERAATEMSVSRSQYIKLERGERRLTADYIERAAKAFGATAGEILSEATEVPLVGYVGAGAEAHFYAHGDGDYEMVPAPEGATSDTVAAEIRGDSLGPLFDRWLVYYDEVRSPVTPDLIGRLCVVGLPDDRVLVKKITRAKTPGLFHLLSNTEEPIFDAEIMWAARVKNMVPR